jgi:HPt (histidine-containing phosphotransfer) domain-containing protein
MGEQEMNVGGTKTTVGNAEARFRVLAALEPEAIPLVDWKRLENVTFGEPGFLREIVALFLAEAARQIAAISAAIGSGSGEDALRAAHALRGAASNVGADQVTELSSELERVLKAGGLEFASPLVDRLEAAVTATRAALEAA